MSKSPKFNIQKYIKPGFDLILELDDEVEYLIDAEAVKSISSNERTVLLKRLVDGEAIVMTSRKVIQTLKKSGPTDYLKDEKAER